MEKGKKYISPLLSFDIHLQNYQNMVREFQKKNDLTHLKAILKDSLTTSLTEQVFNEDYDALVLTKVNQSILWVSDGFKDMTGYSKTFALGKRPKFLQGPDTSSATRKQIREGLANEHTFSGALTNYRKNGESYLCDIKIIPVYNAKNKLINFLAFERELPED